MERTFRARARKLGTLLPRGTAILLLGLAILLLLSLPLFALFASMMADRARLRSAVVAAQVVGAEPATLEALRALRAAAAEGATIEDLLAGAAHAAVPWQAILERVVPPATAGVRLVALTQHGAEIEVRALADAEPSLAAYEARLRGSSLFRSVTLQRGLAQPGAIAFTLTLTLREYTP